MRPSRGEYCASSDVEVAVLPAGPMDRNVASIWMGPAACFHFQHAGRLVRVALVTGAGRDAGLVRVARRTARAPVAGEMDGAISRACSSPPPRARARPRASTPSSGVASPCPRTRRRQEASGREWQARELSLKSFDDLRALWYVLVKEKNMLLTEKHAARANRVKMRSPSHRSGSARMSRSRPPSASCPADGATSSARQVHARHQRQMNRPSNPRDAHRAVRAPRPSRQHSRVLVRWRPSEARVLRSARTASTALLGERTRLRRGGRVDLRHENTHVLLAHRRDDSRLPQPHHAAAPRERYAASFLDAAPRENARPRGASLRLAASTSCTQGSTGVIVAGVHPGGCSSTPTRRVRADASGARARIVGVPRRLELTGLMSMHPRPTSREPRPCRRRSFVGGAAETGG